MRMWQTIEKHCPSCHGKGEVFVDELRGDEYWVTAVQCHCVEVHHDEEMKAFLHKISPDSTLTSG